MRIIAGTTRGRRLQVLPGEDTRPTLERVKEGMFSAVQIFLPGAAVLDLFAGTGQLGLEALSRGAARCVFVENNRHAAELVALNIQNTGFAQQGRLVKSDAEAFLAGTGEKFDLVLLDPPFDGGYYPHLLEKVALVCTPGAQVLCENTCKADMPERAAGLLFEKQYRYGTVMVHRYRMQEETGDDDVP